MQKALIIDGNHIVHRCYHAGILARYSIHSTVQKLQPGHTVVVFDHDDGSPCWRTQLYPEYKANRKRKEEDVIGIKSAIAETQNWLGMMGVKMVSLHNTEGDDVIGSLARKFSKEGIFSQILTDDRDMFQLISDNVEIVLPGKLDTPVGRNSCLDITSYMPEQIVSLKALMGDSSDNYKGVPNIGKAAVAKLLAEWDNADNIYSNIDDVEEKFRGKLIKGYQQYLLCRKLATIRCNYRVPVSLQETITPDAIKKMRDVRTPWF